MRRYHPVLIAMHWLLATMIVLGVLMVTFVFSGGASDASEELLYLRMHMSMGILILVLMIIRLGVRLLTAKPPGADIGNSFLNKLGAAIHYLFYPVVILIAASGLGTAVSVDIPEIMYGDPGVTLPVTFDVVPPRTPHGVLTSVLLLLVISHVLAFLYHQYVRKDRLFSRMWFGRDV